MALKGSLKDKNIIIRLLVWVAIMLLLTIPTVLIWTLTVGTNQTISALRVLQVLQTFAFFILPVLAAVWLWSDRPLHWLRMDKGMSWQTAGLVVLMMLVYSPGINLLSALNQELSLPSWLSELEVWLQAREAEASLLTDRFAQADTIPQLMLNLLIMAVLPAIGEELCFRGTCQGLFAHGTSGPRKPYYNRLRAHTHEAIWITAILFSAIHIQFYGFVPRMLLGALLGYLLCYSGSLYVPMLAHFTNNAVAVICFYIAGKGNVRAEFLEEFGSGDTWWAGVLSLIAGSALMWLFVRRQSSALRLSAPPAA